MSSHQYTLGKLERYFSDADEWHPERWLPSAHALYDPKYSSDNKEAAKPFMMGPRVCIGRNMAWIEMRIVMAKLILLFDWEAVQEIGEGKEVDWVRDSMVRFLWIKPKFRVRYIARKL